MIDFEKVSKSLRIVMVDCPKGGWASILAYCIQDVVDHLKDAGSVSPPTTLEENAKVLNEVERLKRELNEAIERAEQAEKLAEIRFSEIARLTGELDEANDHVKALYSLSEMRLMEFQRANNRYVSALAERDRAFAERKKQDTEIRAAIAQLAQAVRDGGPT